MTITFSSFSLFNLVTLLRGPAMPQPSLRHGPQPLSVSEADEAHADRAFVRELMARNPDAFQSEHGMMMLMALYPKQF